MDSGPKLFGASKICDDFSGFEQVPKSSLIIRAKEIFPVQEELLTAVKVLFKYGLLTADVFHQITADSKAEFVDHMTPISYPAKPSEEIKSLSILIAKGAECGENNKDQASILSKGYLEMIFALDAGVVLKAAAALEEADVGDSTIEDFQGLLFTAMQAVGLSAL